MLVFGVFRLGDVTSGNYEIVINEKPVIDEPVKALEGCVGGCDGSATGG